MKDFRQFCLAFGNLRLNLLKEYPLLKPDVTFEFIFYPAQIPFEFIFISE